MGLHGPRSAARTDSRTDAGKRRDKKANEAEREKIELKIVIRCCRRKTRLPVFPISWAELGRAGREEDGLIGRI
jgi:hypothetical protein